ncbi:MAG: GNAT family N-acetyltransferase [Alphaproteobacteria bacterium]
MSEDIDDDAFRWRPMTRDDLADVARIAALVHPDYPEKDAVFAERLELHPAGNLLLLDPAGKAAGYVVSHPWSFAAAPALDSLLGALPARGDNYYIHDIALLPAARGRGAARKAVERLAALAKLQGCARVSLVAIAGTQAFWERQGFAVIARADLDEILKSYDASARYMSRAV